MPSTGSGSNKGFALVQFEDAEAALEAFQALDKTEFQGRLLHVIPGEAKPGEVSRRQEEAKLKMARISWMGGFNWNALVMSQDAVGASVATRLGVSKSEVLDPTSAEGAVKQAIAETSVIEETKAYFASHGVDLDAFRSRERDASVVLVKSLAYGTTREDLRAKLQEHGTVIRVLMPPSGTIAIVQFADAASGKAVMAKLNGKQFRGTHFMMSLGPRDVFARAPDPPLAPTGAAPPTGATGGPDPRLADAGTAAGGHGATAATAASRSAASGELEECEGGGAHEDEVEAAESSSLYVKNLHFDTTTDDLAKAFGHLDGFVSAKVMAKPDAQQPGKVLSMGFGFVQFRTKPQAVGAAKNMDGHILAGHSLGVKLSHRRLDAAEERRRTEAARKQANQRTKLIVKNLPFETTKKDLRMLLSKYGELRSVRIPRKANHSSRGFAFAEFVSPQEAQSAHGALQHTHLLGRKLAIDYAEADTVDPEEELARMQKKVAGQVRKVALQRLSRRGRTKVNFGTGDDEGDDGLADG
jgi:multiple RNA-binding domain-containing protein 1